METTISSQLNTLIVTENRLPPVRIWVCILVLSAIAFVSFPTDLKAGPEGRTRTFCIFDTRACGGHLQPQCTSGSICDAGHNSYVINVKINCPWPIADEKIVAGCYDRRPSCNDCSANGQIPCPVEAEPFCRAGCDAGLISHPTTTLCGTPSSSGIPPGDVGNACGPGFPCKSGLACDETKLQCVGKTRAGQSCANLFVPCANGLSCTGALECSHIPAQKGETCDVANPCAAGLFCAAGIPQRCKAKRRVGQGCSAFNPCVDGASCEVCLVEGCNSPLQCFPNSADGVISEQVCRNLRDPGLHRQIQNQGLTRTYSVGNSGAALVGESQEFGVAYGANGSYGCFTSLCAGVNLDLGIEHFLSLGFYNVFDSVGGQSFVVFEEIQLGNVLNYAANQIWPRAPGEVRPSPSKLIIGTAATFSIGTPTNPIPVAGGVLNCETVLDKFAVDTDLGGVVIVPITPGPGPEPEIEPITATGAIKFTGSLNNKLALTNATALNALTLTEGVSAGLWFNPSQPNQSVSFLSKEGEYQIGLRNGELAYSIANTVPGWQWVNSGFYPPVNKWTHVTITYQSMASTQTDLTVYINGRVAHRILGSGLIGDRHPAETQLQLGGRQLSTEIATFAGRLDDVQIWSRALTPSEVRESMNEISLSSVADLITAWHFNEPSGLIVKSEKGSEYDIVLDGVGGSERPQRTSNTKTGVNGGILFDGTANHVGVIADDSLTALKVTDALTLEAWVYVNGPGIAGNTKIIDKTGEYSLGLLADGTLTFELATTTPGWGIINTTAVIEEKKWTHVALTYDRLVGELKIFINGQIAHSQAASGTVDDTDISDDALRIGQGFNGIIDEVRVWASARSSAQIKASYNVPLSATLPGLSGYWQFNERELVTSFDSSGQHHHALLGSGNDWEVPARINITQIPSYPPLLLKEPCSLIPFPDDDADGVCDAIDNCPLIKNSGQTDNNSDGTGDACTTSTNDPKVTLVSLSATNRTVKPGTKNVILLRFQLQSNYAGSSFNAITLTATGTGNDVTRIETVKLWEDINANGEIDAGDRQVDNGVYTSNNGTIVLSPDSSHVLAFGQTDFIVSYDFK